MKKTARKTSCAGHRSGSARVAQPHRARWSACGSRAARGLSSKAMCRRPTWCRLVRRQVAPRRSRSATVGGSLPTTSNGWMRRTARWFGANGCACCSLGSACTPKGPPFATHRVHIGYQNQFLRNQTIVFLFEKKARNHCLPVGKRHDFL